MSTLLRCAVGAVATSALVALPAAVQPAPAAAAGEGGPAVSGHVAAAPTLAPATRLAATPVTLGATSWAVDRTAATLGTWRAPVNIRPYVYQWRVHVSNFHVGQGTPSGTGIRLGGVWFGGSAGWQTKGGYSSGPVKVMGPVTLPDDGRDVASPWQSTQIGGGAEKLLTWSVTGYKTAPLPAEGYAWRTGDATSVRPSVSTPVKSMPLDVWVEVRVAASTPVVAVFGDSQSVGMNCNRPVFDAPLNIWARRAGGIATINASSGANMGVWKTGGKRVERFAAYKPDVVVYAMGFNDIFGAKHAWWTVRQDLSTLHARVSQVFTPRRVYFDTLYPWTKSTDQILEGRRRSYNHWLVTYQGSRAKNVVPWISADDERILWQYNQDGTHLNSVGNGVVAKAWGTLGF